MSYLVSVLIAGILTSAPTVWGDEPRKPPKSPEELYDLRFALLLWQISPVFQCFSARSLGFSFPKSASDRNMSSKNCWENWFIEHTSTADKCETLV